MNIKLPMYLFYYMALIWFWWGQIHYSGPLEELGPENLELFGAQMALASLIAISGPKKSLDLQGPLLPSNTKFFSDIRKIAFN
jgi:hypothetical protein